MKILIMILVGLLTATNAMAGTKVERLTAVADALIDGTATSAQKLVVASAFVAGYRQEIVDAGLDPDNLTNEQAAGVVIYKIKQYVRMVVRQNDVDLDAAQTAVDTAKAAVTTAAATAAAEAESQWPTEALE